MSTLIDITEAAVREILRGALLDLTPSGVASECILAQVNRVPEPALPNFCIMTPLRRERLATNIDSVEDVILQASIAGTVMTVTSVEDAFGNPQTSLRIGAALVGPNIAAGTTVVTQTAGPPGGAGTYSVSVSQSVASQAMYTGLLHARVSTMVVTQLDIHGPASPEWAQGVSTLLRDEWATSYFRQAMDGVMPLYTTDPRQMAFVNAESQYEDRWTLDTHIQANPTVSVLQEFASTVSVGIINVDAAYPG